MLPLVALSETAPLVIDQPEDNLDQRMVGKTLTKILADLKETRQIIVTTHNPNIVVGGDAEQVIVFEPVGAHEARVEDTGSIDDHQIIDHVLAIMVGGGEAFQARRRRRRSCPLLVVSAPADELCLPVASLDQRPGSERHQSRLADRLVLILEQRPPAGCRGDRNDPPFWSSRRRHHLRTIRNRGAPFARVNRHSRERA